MTSERAGAYNHTGVVTGQRLPAGGPSSREGCVRQARGADMRVAVGGPVSQRLSGDEVLRQSRSYARSTFKQPTAIHGTFAPPRWW